MKNTLGKIIDYAARIADPEEIILFGSMSTGKANLFSDVDLLIISDNPAIRKDVAARIRSFSRELSLKSDVLIYSRLEIESETQKPNSFIAAIIKSGKIVYKKKQNICKNNLT